MGLIRNTFFLFSLFLIASVDSFLERDTQIMKIKDEQQIQDLLERGANSKVRRLLQSRIHDNLKNMQTSKHTSVPRLFSSFKWDICSSGPALFNLKNLTIGPDPLYFPNNIFVQFQGIIKKNIDAPLQANVTLKKKITDSFWLKLPCIDGVGSCNYDDFCETLEGATCPDPFVKYDIPCKYPFLKGSYKMQKSAFFVNVKAIPTGNYYMKANLSYMNQLVICLEVYFAVA